jgi:peptidoglycan/LPS O-acetylase OafA/YrhL
MRAHPNLTYQPGLDGLRALAIIAVLLYHGGVPWAGGGFLGVETFFVLSGFLITSLLLAEWCETSRIKLGAFWARRARRLLPALFALVCAIGLYYTLAGPLAAIPGLKSSGIATLLYFGNWHQVAAGSSYFVASGPTSPLQHTWSLAIEEQFYLLWPLLLVAVVWLGGRGAPVQRRPLATLLVVTIAAAVASVCETVVLYRGGTGLDRVYYGTDTRATGLLIGASFAIALAIARLGGRAQPASGRTPIRSTAALIALAIVLGAMHVATGQSTWLFPWGFVVIDLAVVSVIAAVVLMPRSLVARLFSAAPLRWTGMVSYGLYLWHFPCFLWITSSSTGLMGVPLLLLRLGTSVSVAVISFVLIEQPIRRHKVPTQLLRPLVPVAAAAALTALFAAGAVGAELQHSNAAPVPANVDYHYAHEHQRCTLALRDTSQYRTVPLPQQRLGGYIFHWILKGAVNWNGGGYPQSARERFHACPPTRVMMIGDSLAFTAGVPMLNDENRYDVELANAAILGCAFGTRGEPNVNGTYKPLPSQCPNALNEWEHAARKFHAQVVAVELGYRDEFNWRWNGHVVHLGQRAFDSYVQHQIDHFAAVLTEHGARVLFLTVPYVQPPALPNGDPAPAAAVSRHQVIDSMLARAAAQEPAHVQVLNIDDTVSPGNHYDQTVNGQPCRFDGIHFTIYCASLLQPSVLGAAQKLGVA